MAYHSEAILSGHLRGSSAHEYTVSTSTAQRKFSCVFELSSESSYLAWSVYVHGVLNSLT